MYHLMHNGIHYAAYGPVIPKYIDVDQVRIIRVIIAMYFKAGNPELVAPITLGDKVALLFTCALILLIGVAPQLFLNV